jgi:trehalose-phosphatase
MSSPLFDAIGEIHVRVGSAPHLLIGLDFDGTLTRIVDEPALACLSPHMRRVLESLVRYEDVSVAIVSGRERNDLLTRVAIPGLIYAGNHGLEISGAGFIFVEPTALECRSALESLAALLTERLRSVAGAMVEDKGLTLSVHYRQVAPAQHDEVRRIVHAALASTDHPFQLTTGDMVYDVRPRVYWNKGSAIHWIKERLGKPDALIIYMGDDTTDEDAFAALADGITVKIGGPRETAAQYHVDGPPEVRCFLDWIDDTLRQRRAAASCGIA